MALTGGVNLRSKTGIQLSICQCFIETRMKERKRKGGKKEGRKAVRKRGMEGGREEGEKKKDMDTQILS